MSEQFPLFRLATLLARQLSSPIASRIKEYAKGHPRFGRTVCVRTGRAAAALELRLRLWSVRASTRYAAGAGRALPDRVALENGADLLGEMVLFALGSLIIIYEFNRQALKQEDKVAMEEGARHALRLQLDELRLELERQQEDIERLAAVLRSLASATSPGPQRRE